MLQQTLANVPGQLQPALREQAFQFLGIQRQGLRVDFLQFALQQQARQVPGRTAASADPPAHLRRAALQQAVEAGIQFGAGLAWVVVEEDPQRLFDALQQSLQFDLRSAVADGHVQGAGQAGEQIARFERLAVQVEPDHLYIRLGQAGAFAEQHALAEAGRRAEQVQPLVSGEQALGETRAVDVPGRQTRQRGARLAQTGGGGEDVDLLVLGHAAAPGCAPGPHGVATGEAGLVRRWPAAGARPRGGRVRVRPPGGTACPRRRGGRRIAHRWAGPRRSSAAARSSLVVRWR
ncbi:hypothetical protein D9M71_300370 [compost metagenome]